MMKKATMLRARISLEISQSLLLTEEVGSFNESQDSGHCVLNILFGDSSDGELGLDLVLELRNSPVALLCSFASCNSWILFIMTSIPVAAEKRRPEESLKERSGAQLAAAANLVTPTMVDVARVIVLMELRSIPVITLLADVVVHLNMIGDCFENHIQFRFDEIVCVRL